MCTRLCLYYGVPRNVAVFSRATRECTVEKVRFKIDRERFVFFSVCLAARHGVTFMFMPLSFSCPCRRFATCNTRGRASRGGGAPGSAWVAAGDSTIIIHQHVEQRGDRGPWARASRAHATACGLPLRCTRRCECRRRGRRVQRLRRCGCGGWAPHNDDAAGGRGCRLRAPTLSHLQLHVVERPRRAYRGPRVCA
jgi:hypothetical protein